MKRQHAARPRTPASSACTRRISGAPGRKQSTCPPGARERRAHRVGHRRARLVAHLDRVRARLDLHDRAVVEEARDRSGVERRRHHDEPKLRARPPRLARERQRQVRVQAALVELVEHDRPEAREQRVGLQAPRQHALRGHQQPRVLREAPLEANLEAHLLAERPAVLLGDPPRDRARGHAPRLQQEDRPVGDERRRHARRLPRSGRRHEHEGARGPQHLGDAADVRVDGKRREHPPGRADGNPAA